jgi:hypothetical protein
MARVPMVGSVVAHRPPLGNADDAGIFRGCYFEMKYCRAVHFSVVCPFCSFYGHEGFIECKPCHARSAIGRVPDGVMFADCPLSGMALNVLKIESKGMWYDKPQERETNK